MTDLLPVAILFACWVACGLAVAFIAPLFEPRDDAGSDGPHGDVPFIPGDLKKSVFHSTTDTAEGQ